MEETKLRDAGALLSGLPEHNLKRGDVGTVVEVFKQTPITPPGASSSSWTTSAARSMPTLILPTPHA